MKYKTHLGAVTCLLAIVGFLAAPRPNVNSATCTNVGENCPSSCNESGETPTRVWHGCGGKYTALGPSVVENANCVAASYLCGELVFGTEALNDNGCARTNPYGGECGNTGADPFCDPPGNPEQ